ncbi:TPA: hypothetical protein DCE37_05515 [Candidatus Latescibacteria bacterium]|nr:hypothetical protein [Candidatus Latescibacterota bacterium]
MQANHITPVDDEDDVCLVLEDLFRSRGYTVSTAEDGAAALEKLKGTGGFPDFLLADYQMPNVNGIDFLTQSLEVCPQAMRILLTAHGDLQVAVDAINQAQAHNFITKPFNNKPLTMNAQRVLGH